MQLAAGDETADGSEKRYGQQKIIFIGEIYTMSKKEISTALLSGEDYEKTVKRLLLSDHGNRMLVVLTYSAACYMYEHLTKSGVKPKPLVLAKNNIKEAAKDFSLAVKLLHDSLSPNMRGHILGHEPDALNDGLKRQCILLELLDIKIQTKSYTDEEKSLIRLLGAELKKSVDKLEPQDIYGVYKSMVDNLIQWCPMPHAKRIAVLSCGIWLLGITAGRLGTQFYRCFGDDQDEIEELVAKTITLPNLDWRMHYDD